MNIHFCFITIVIGIVNLIKCEVKLEFFNKEPGPIWVGIQGNRGHTHLNNGGFFLQQGSSKIILAPDNWSGKFWPRTWCDISSKRCETGRCGSKVECAGEIGTPPFTLIELNLKAFKGVDYYAISLEYGMNLRGFIEPGADGEGSCKKAQCLLDINGNCLNELRMVFAGQTIGCFSPCTKFNTDHYCCRGFHDRPETCKSSEWSQDFAAFYKNECPDAHSYFFDSNKKIFTCKSNYYKIQFGVSF